ncbi:MULTISPECIES: hypothetical protein [unclassified Fibrobacter]|uniref:hypothetical protein n=1 Tax=unclassified Fibrobacter TaxID=2634177 RepID=UPI000D6DA295|nr:MULTISPECIES: hypothetical protein [unclassified Fibrobacter]PWJ62783.1 hypothetical protein BGX12_12072 [Fibrobacter sp. UWR4]PZW63726.1 hypothetical protein C8E88_10416 [Fibrobacter sp. UWR1]
MKLQQAYFSESSMAGGWQLIGYLAPNNGSTTNFTYDHGAIAEDGSDALDDNKLGWGANNNANLNECTKKDSGNNWTVTLSKASGTTQADIAFAASAGDAGCVALTPTFDKIGK